VRQAAPLVLALAAACSSPHRYEEPASITLFGPGARLETWDAQASSGSHLHPRPGALCLPLAGLLRTAIDEPGFEGVAETVPAIVDELTVPSFGKACGGRGRLALAMRHYAPGSDEADEALMVVVPVLRPDEAERTFEKGQVAAEYNRPITSTRAAFESGRVAVRRLEGDRFEFEIFLVLRDPNGERLQVVTRVEARAAR
jgi:hypothetical protein